MITEFLPYSSQTIDEDDISAVAEVLRSKHLTSGPAVEAFEASLSKRMNNVEVVSCSSGTAGLHLAALALDLGPGDWVIVPAITFLATANAIRYTGAEVIFCDVNPETGLMTKETLESSFNQNKDKRIRAIFSVHLAGQPADPKGIFTIANREGLRVVEDACHALGTSYSSPTENSPVPVGSCAHSDMSVFSFHPIKAIACGEGGAVSTNNQKLAKRLRLFRNHGLTRDTREFESQIKEQRFKDYINPWYYELKELGFNYRLSDINAALGHNQISKLDKFLSQRQEIVDYYDERISGLGSKIRAIKKITDCKVGWHLYPVLIDFFGIDISRADLMEALKLQGIGTQVHYIPVSSQPYYKNRYGTQDLKGAECYYSATLSLPLFPKMGLADVDRVVKEIKKFL